MAVVVRETDLGEGRELAAAQDAGGNAVDDDDDGEMAAGAGAGVGAGEEDGAAVAEGPGEEIGDGASGDGCVGEGQMDAANLEASTVVDMASCGPGWEPGTERSGSTAGVGCTSGAYLEPFAQPGRWDSAGNYHPASNIER